MIFTKAITGKENDGQDGTPQVALQMFYGAFNNRNLNDMATNWLQTDEASMSNPLGGVKRGWEEIKGVYEHLFNGPAVVYVEFYDYSVHQQGDFFCAVGKERGVFEKDEVKLELAIRTSRIYRRQDGSWLQLHHHGSMDNPALLKTYQTTVLESK